MGVTSAGKAELAGLAGNTGSCTAFTYLELGDGSTAFAVGQTALVSAITGNGLARAAATVSRTTTNVTNDTLRLTKTWTATGSETIREAGVFNASSSGDMLARTVLDTARALSNGSSYTYTYDTIFA